MTDPIPAADGFTDDSIWRFPLEGGVIVEATERPDSPVLDRFFAGYDRAFVLPDEREELDGFRACLGINPQTRHRFGRTHREFVVTISDAADATLLGGANFLATHIDGPADHPPVAVALNYVYVESAARGRGLSRKLLEAVALLANRGVGAGEGAPPPAIFIEQNDPLCLTEEEYAADSAHAGIDQIDRLALWARLGARMVDFPYVQPALSADQSSDDGLTYAAVGFPLDAIDPAYFRAHLESFFGISVLKGGDPAGDPAAGPQLERLAAMARAGEDVPLVAIEGVIARLRALPARPTGLSFREFARGG